MFNLDLGRHVCELLLTKCSLCSALFFNHDRRFQLALRWCALLNLDGSLKTCVFLLQNDVGDMQNTLYKAVDADKYSLDSCTIVVSPVMNRIEENLTTPDNLMAQLGLKKTETPDGLTISGKCCFLSLDINSAQ